MFRDLKEYQEIAKIYADKVSKPENLEERRGGNISPEQIKKNQEGLKNRIMTGNPEGKKPVNTSQSNNKRGASFRPNPINKPINSGASNKRAEMSNRRREMQNKPSNTDASGKVIPSTAEIRAKAAAKRGGTPAIGGGNAGASTDSGGTSKSTIKSVEQKPEISKFTKQGKPRTKAQMMAAKRIGSGTAKNPDTTIAQVKQSNQDAMRARAKEKFAAFKAKRAEKKAAMVAKEEYTPYDIVLEYLLSTEQAATIEEANYVMTEMDGKTINDIVEMQGQINRADIIGGTQAAKNAAAGKGKYTPGKGVTKDFKLDPAFQLPKA